MSKEFRYTDENGQIVQVKGSEDRLVDELTLEPWELIDQTFVKEDPYRDHVTFQDEFYLGEA